VLLNTRATATGLLASAAGVAGGYVLLVRGSLTLDLGIGRRLRPLGPITEWLAAPPEIVFDVIAGPYLGRTPRAMQDKLRVLERGADMVVAKHFRHLCDGYVQEEEDRDHMTKAKLKVSGMHCGSCALSVDDALEELEGVKKSSTSFARGRTKLEYDETKVDLDTVRSVIAELGYQAA
jgi:copper chaperone CopZ